MNVGLRLLALGQALNRELTTLVQQLEGVGTPLDGGDERPSVERRAAIEAARSEAQRIGLVIDRLLTSMDSVNAILGLAESQIELAERVPAAPPTPEHVRELLEQEIVR